MEKQQTIHILKILLKIVLIAFSVVLLIYPALQNGYPLLYSDSATYIASGHDHNVPIDRPIFYGLFVWNTCFGYSLWIVVFLQAFIVLALIYYTFLLFVPREKVIYFTFFSILLLGLFTGLPNYVCQIMPDLFSGILIWLIVLFYFSTTTLSRIVIGAGLIFSAVVHNSNLLTFTILVALLVCISLFFKQSQLKLKSLYLLMLVVGAWILVPSVNYAFKREWYVSKGGGVFFLGRLIEMGIVKDYLDEQCQKQNFELCQFKDKLPEHGWQFCWEPTSPLYAGGCYETGWGNCWLNKNDEYRKIIMDILTTPKYLVRFVKISLKDFLRQFIYFDMIHFAKLDKGGGLDSVVEHYLKDHYMMADAKQLKESIFYPVRNMIQRYFIGLCTLVILVWLFANTKRKKVSTDCWLIILIVFSGLVINAYFVSAISCVECRYQGRIIWLVPLVAVLLFLAPGKFRKTSYPEK
jgi:hypothetical protein